MNRQPSENKSILLHHINAGDCKKLWQRVLINGIADALGQPTGLNKNAQRNNFVQAGKAWLGSEDFFQTCTLAGLDPHFVIGKIRDGTLTLEKLQAANAVGKLRHKQRKENIQ